MTDQQPPATPPSGAEGDAPLGVGASAEVWAWPGNTVAKVFFEHWPRARVEWEYAAARRAFGGGVRTPRPLDLIETGGRSALVFERLRGNTLGDELRSAPVFARRLLREFGTVHRHIHGVDAAELGDQRRFLAPFVRSADGLADSERAGLLSHLSELPGNALCHNDFHPENIVVQEERLWVVDWGKGNAGSPEVDVATTLLKLARAVCKLERVPRRLAAPAIAMVQRWYQAGYRGAGERLVVRDATARLVEIASVR